MRDESAHRTCQFGRSRNAVLEMPLDDGWFENEIETFGLSV